MVDRSVLVDQVLLTIRFTGIDEAFHWYRYDFRLLKDSCLNGPAALLTGMDEAIRTGMSSVAVASKVPVSADDSPASFLVTESLQKG